MAILGCRDGGSGAYVKTTYLVLTSSNRPGYSFIWPDNLKHVSWPTKNALMDCRRRVRILAGGQAATLRIDGDRTGIFKVPPDFIPR